LDHPFNVTHSEFTLQHAATWTLAEFLPNLAVRLSELAFLESPTIDLLLHKFLVVPTACCCRIWGDDCALMNFEGLFEGTVTVEFADSALIYYNFFELLHEKVFVLGPVQSYKKVQKC
jgi:hypothetical protein